MIIPTIVKSNFVPEERSAAEIILFVPDCLKLPYSSQIADRMAIIMIVRRIRKIRTGFFWAFLFILLLELEDLYIFVLVEVEGKVAKR